MRALRMFDGLKTITRRGSIGTSSPVFGLRPMRRPLERTMEGAEGGQLHLLALGDRFDISLSTNSTMEAHSVRDRPTLR